MKELVLWDMLGIFFQYPGKRLYFQSAIMFFSINGFLLYFPLYATYILLSLIFMEKNQVVCFSCPFFRM